MEKKTKAKKKNHLEKKITEKSQEQKTLVRLSKCESQSSKHIKMSRYNADRQASRTQANESQDTW